MAETRGVQISDLQVETAIAALKKVQQHWLGNENRKAKLLGEDENCDIFLQISLKKIPEIKNTKMIKVFLSHWPQVSREVCLFTGDLDKKNPRADCEETVQFYKQLLKKHKVTGITEVISLRELRTDYKQYEARRKLCGAYDTFLADKKIGGCLPKALGNSFMKNRKFPQQVDLQAKDLKKEITNALAHTVCCLTGRGSNCAIYVGTISQPERELTENIMSTITKLSSVLPGTGKNIRQIHVKCAKSLAIPLYFSLDSANEVIMPSPPSPEEVLEDELTTLQKSKVRVFSDGKVDVFPVSDSEVSEIDEIEKEILENERKFVEGRLRKQQGKTKRDDKKPSEEHADDVLEDIKPKRKTKRDNIKPNEEHADDVLEDVKPKRKTKRDIIKANKKHADDVLEDVKPSKRSKKKHK